MNQIFLSTNLSKLLSFTPSTKAVSEVAVVEAPSTWEQAKSVSAYATNLYLLDSINGLVMKHVARDSGYSKGSGYADTKKISLKDAVDLAVDGNIYVLKADGTTAKFVKGAWDPDFSLKGIPSPDSQIIEPSKIFTDDTTNNIFVLDKAKNRVIKFDKAGDYLNQYIFDNVSIDDFVVNTKLQKIWILSEGKIYEGSL